MTDCFNTMRYALQFCKKCGNESISDSQPLNYKNLQIANCDILLAAELVGLISVDSRWPDCPPRSRNLGQRWPIEAKGNTVLPLIFAFRYCRVRFDAFQLDNLCRNSCMIKLMLFLS